MKCKKCGEELVAGKVYCPNCGTEVQMVPDYNDLDEDFDTIIAPERKYEKVKEEEDDFLKEEEKKPLSKRSITIIITAAVVLLVVIVLSVSLIFTNNQKNKDFAFQYGEASEYLNQGRADLALKAVEKALLVEPENEEALLLLAKIQVELDNKDEAINTLLSLVAINPDSLEGYEFLLSLYAEKEDYDAIKELSKDISNDYVMGLFRSYLPTAPSFSVEAGEYDEVISVELSSDADSTIYYTTDGSDPTTFGVVYTSEIAIESGTVTIRAVAHNELGVYSDEVEATYNVILAIPDKPNVSVPSGTYDELQFVMVTVPDGCEAYYTWDGTTPTKASIKYIEPIEILEGNNILSIVIINSNEQCSDVARFNYIYYPAVEDEVEED